MRVKAITLYRPKERFNKNCSYVILVGNRRLTELKNGEEKSIEIPNGSENETLKAKIQWCGSEEIELRNLTGNERIIVSGNKFLNRKLPLLGAVFPLTTILLFNTTNLISKNILTGFLILFLLGLIGTLTIGKNKWLKLKKE